MLFNSATFAAFLPLVFGLFFLLRRGGRTGMLVAASYVFYCWETPAYGLLLLASTILDYSVGRLMEHAARPRQRKWLLACSLAGNFSMLGFFKYADFLGENLVGLGRLLGYSGSWAALDFILPVGISFYTFQTVSYTIQVYRKECPVEHDFLAFALYVSFFPQLVAGPIERASHLLPQLKSWQPIRADDLRIGLERIISGLFMKLVIADRLAIFVDLIFAHPGHYPALTLWAAAICFTGQIYMDFAGYASIAIGTARLFGVRIVENFNYPMAARNSGDFWARWHITLTSWFRDYLFLPLGGFRRGGFRSAVNGGIVLVLCGFWHGAEWNFIAWGAFHAVLMILYFSIRTLRRKLRPAGARRKPPTGIRVLPWALFTLALNAVGVVFFRAPNMETAWKFLGGMFLGGADPAASVEAYVWIFLAIAAALFLYDFGHAHLRWETLRRRMPWYLRSLGYAVLAALTVWGAVNFEAPYIYFQF